ncbi:dockerin type I domain-containing protein [Anatilimnocola floriformis]|uniref:dockerin type I domain-containing protein n=1 Tax=Anatilimnocola floriformis TaxID=2948575 RepID=UPI0020C43C48|nr:dockerin type I domain-containing protein [Anatilimnocola floriformis]
MPFPTPRLPARPRFRRLFLESLEDRQLLAADWRNPVDSLDINNDRMVTAFDAIAIINELNQNGVHALPLSKPADSPYLDLNGNGTVSAFDVIPVINLLNTAQAYPTSQLIEKSGALLQEYSITITTGGVTAGNRLYQFKVEPHFDLSDQFSATEDVFLAYLIDPRTGETLINSGTRGGALFSLAGTEAELHSGLVQWDGTFLTLDLSQFNATDTLELRFQLLNPDSDSGTRVTVIPWSNKLDVTGVPLAPGPDRPQPLTPGTEINTSSLIVLPDLNVELANISYQAATGRFSAEARVVNKSTSTLNPASISFPRLAGVTSTNASGTAGGEVYWSFAGVPTSGQLAPQETSPWLKIEFELPADQPLDLFAVARGTVTTDMAKFGIFSGTLTDTSEQYFAKFAAQANEDFLVVPIRVPTPAPTIRLVNKFDVVIAGTPTSLAGPFYPIDSPLSGEYQLQLTAKGPGDFAFAVHNLETVELLQPGDRRWGVFDYQLGPQVYAIEGLAGSRIVIDNLLPPGERTGTWQLMSADSTTIGFANLVAGDYELTLPVGGRYYLIHSPPDNSTAITNYDFAVRTPDVVAHALTLGSTLTVTMNTFAERHEYSFTGARNQQIIIDSLLQNGEEITLMNPLGEVLPVPQEQPIVLDQAGAWKLVVKGAAPGTISFRVLDAENLPVLTNGMLLNGTVSAAEPDFFRIPMVAGQRLKLTPGNADVFVVDVTGASGQLLSPTAPLSYGLAETGNGLLRISRNAATPETHLYSYTVGLSLAGSVTASGFDLEYVGSLGFRQSTSIPFTASAGTPIFVDWLIDPMASTTVEVQLREPNGQLTSLTRSPNTKDSNIITLTQSGNHQIVLTNPGSAGGYAIRIVDLSTVPLLSPEDTISGTLTGFRTLARRVDAEIGDRLQIDSLRETYQEPDATVRVYREQAVDFPYTTDDDRWIMEFTSSQQHYILIEQLTSASTPLTIKTELMQHAEIFPFGTTASVTLNAKEGKLFRFPAQAGQKFFVDYVSAFPYNSVQVGFGEGVPVNYSGPNTPLVLNIRKTGEQYLYFKNISSSTKTFSFVATPLNSTSPATPLVFDLPQTVTLASEGEHKIFSFSAEEGQLLYFDGMDPLGNEARFRIIDQTTGEMSDFRPAISSLTTGKKFMYAVPRTGSYALILSDNVGTFHFRVVDVRNAPLVQLDTNFTGSIAGDRQAAIWRFEAGESQKLFIDSNATAAMRFESRLQVYRPNGQNGGFTIATVDNDFSASAGDAGVHYLVAEGGATAFNYDLRIRTPDVNTLPIAIGSLASGRIEDQTELDEYTFTGARGQRIQLDPVNSTVTITLIKPDDTTLAIAGDYSYLLPETGTYRVRVTSSSPVSYQFYLLDPSAQTQLPLGTLVTGNTTAVDARFFHLAATAGQRFNFDSQSLSGATSNARWLLYGPQGTKVFDVAFATGDQTVTLTETGDYLLALRAPAGVINYSFQVNSIVQTPVISSGLDQTYNGTIPENLAANVEFTANAGQQVYLDLLERSTFPGSTRLYGPGNVVVTSSINQDGWLSLPFSGNYRLELRGGLSATPYSFRLINAENLPPITVGAPFTVTLDQSYETLIWPLDVTVGDQRLYATPSFIGNLSLRMPDGTSSISGGTNAPQVTTFTQTGRHYLALKGSALSAPLTTSALISDPALATPIQLDTLVSGKLSPSPGYNLFNIDLDADERVYVETTALLSPNAGRWLLLDPTHPNGPVGSSNNLSLPFAYTAPKAGKYLLMIWGVGSYELEYTLRIKQIALTKVVGNLFDHGFGI